jgi:hypothetical protein
MAERRCLVYIDKQTRKVLGRIVEPDREVKTQAWYLGRLIEQHPDAVREMVEKKYAAWAAAYGVPATSLSIEFGPLPEELPEGD